MKMKIAMSSLIMAFALMIQPLMAQQQHDCKGHQHRLGDEKGQLHKCAIPNLTAEQEKQIEQLKLKHQKEMLPLRNALREKHARMQTLETAEKADMAAINKTIDEIATIKTDMQKKRAAHRQEIRNVLNEEQRLVFDSKGQGHKGNKMHKGKCCK